MFNKISDKVDADCARLAEDAYPNLLRYASNDNDAAFDVLRNILCYILSNLARDNLRPCDYDFFAQKVYDQLRNELVFSRGRHESQ